MKAKEGELKSVMQPQAQSSSMHRFFVNSSLRIQGARSREVPSDGSKLTMEERLKIMDSTLENLKQMLQFQLDFLENLDSEAGKRMEKLEQDITTTKFSFIEELSKLHQELKNPKEEFEQRIG